MENEINLKVKEAMQDDKYKGIARIDSKIMKELGIKRGDIIIIKGYRETVAIAEKALPSDIGEKIIRIDGILRSNAKTGVESVVSISKAEIKDAKKIIIAPLQHMMIQNPEALKLGLLGRAVIKGDTIVLKGVQRRFDLMSNEFDDMNEVNDLIGNMLGGFGFGNLGGKTAGIRFSVVFVNPNQPVMITEKTKVILEEESIEERIPQKKLIEISTMPNIKNYIQVNNIQDILKLANAGHFVNKFQDNEKIIYTAANYFFLKKIKKEKKK